MSELIFLVFDGSQRVKYVNVDKAGEGGSYGLQKKSMSNRYGIKQTKADLPQIHIIQFYGGIVTIHTEANGS